MVRQNYPYDHLNRAKAASDDIRETSDIAAAEQFVADWGSGQSTDIEMLEELLGLMGYEEIHPNSWAKMN
jgi:hypothetical protein